MYRKAPSPDHPNPAPEKKHVMSTLSYCNCNNTIRNSCSHALFRCFQAPVPVVWRSRKGRQRPHGGARRREGAARKRKFMLRTASASLQRDGKCPPPLAKRRQRRSALGLRQEARPRHSLSTQRGIGKGDPTNKSLQTHVRITCKSPN